MYRIYKLMHLRRPDAERVGSGIEFAPCQPGWSQVFGALTSGCPVLPPMRERGEWAYPPGHSDLWGASPPPSPRMKAAQKKIEFAAGLFRP
ncbi:MAG: hypothetical protein A3G27_03750 [Betaproteobacteria bacterium RIFCSPLOWO2_12_FULL_66_14]|nr:MAG: hypothetical protein A3G27_03750 [Betaproteobacteria bacterium RIFCSPLOWO2_12_FULL_66_14]